MTHDTAAALVLLTILGLTALTAYCFGLAHGAKHERARVTAHRRSITLAQVQQRRHASWDERP